MKRLIKQEQIRLKGIYRITNLLNQEFYIGSTYEGFRARYYKYKSSYKLYKKEKGRNVHPHLFRAFDKYGWDNFEYKIIEILDLPKIEIRIIEEEYIAKLDPHYNICKEPSKGGSPNQGRKLSQEWKDNIGKKSKLYKHSDNIEVLAQVSQKNKDTSSIYRIEKEGVVFEGSLTDCTNIIGCHETSILNWIRRTYNTRDYKGWKVTLLRTQKKKIKVNMENESITFKSLGDCDKYFKMWRGYTSTMTLRNELLLQKYSYEIL